MIRQIYFEFRKHFLKLPVCAVVIIFLLLDAFQISNVYQDKSVFSIVPEWQARYENLYPVYGGQITDKKIKELMTYYRPLKAEGNLHPGSEYEEALMLQKCFVEPLQYAYEYRQDAAQISKRALENADFYQQMGNIYASRKNQQIAGMFSGRWIPELHYTEMYQHYLQYDFSVFLVLLLVIYGLVNVFVLEKETEMELLLQTTIQGKRKSATAKLLASVLFVISISILFWLADFLLFGCMFGSFDGGNCPIYAIEYFEASPLSMSLFFYALGTMVLKTVGALIFGMIVLLLSRLCKNTLFPFVGSVFLIGSCLLAYNADLPSVCNPVSLLVCRDLFHWVDFVDLAGIPVLTWQLCLGTALLMLTVFSIVILCANRKCVKFIRRGGLIRGHLKV